VCTQRELTPIDVTHTQLIYKLINIIIYVRSHIVIAVDCFSKSTS